MMETSNKRPKMYDVSSLIAAGIDPKTGLPLALHPHDVGFKLNNKKLLRIMDEQDAINRFTWYNLPHGLNSQLLERILYYKGQAAFFYMKENDTFYFLPYALDGSIDVYGRFTSITPLPFNGSTNDGDTDKQKPWINGLSRKCVYDIKLDELKMEDMTESCVLLKDYSEQISQINIPRQILNDPLLDVMSNIIPYMNTALLNGTGIQGMRVNSEDEASNVEAASQSIDYAALTGRKFIPIVGNVDFQEMTGGEILKAEEFLLAMQSLDNYRLSTYGLESGGLFQKNDQMLNAEVALDANRSNLIMMDSLVRRQHFCDIVNSIWGLGIWCERSDAAAGSDIMGSIGSTGDEDMTQGGSESSGGDNE